ncbi:MAG: hypothetical protein GWN86_07285, partial [Desulfobacterales bacterium]|nr:hypothetical protein [Desulfobacterales bacterium]
MDRRRLVIFLLIILVLIAGLILSADDKNFKQIDTGENPRYIGVKYPDLKAVRGTGGGEGDEVKEVWVSETYSHSIAIFDADSDRLKGR